MKTVTTILVMTLLSCVCRAETLEPGLIGEYLLPGGMLRDFPEFETVQKANLKRIDKTVDFPKAYKMRGVRFTNNFFVRWTGKIRVPEGGEYTFFLESDDGSQLFIYGRKVVDNGGLHGMKEMSGTLDLPAGDHPIRIDYFQGGSLLGCRLSWQSKTIPKQIIPATALVHERSSREPKPEPGPGLIGEFFDMGHILYDFPLFEEYEKPTGTRIDPLIAFPDAESFSIPFTNHFYSRWTGKLNVPRVGDYTFYLSSDDGSRMYVDGKVAVDHSGLHQFAEKAGKVHLSEGAHDVKIEYFQNEGVAACALWWEGPGIKKDVAPRAVLSH